MKLWSIEDEKRICEKNKDFGKKFIELARNVYINNDRRAKIKSEINKEYESLNKTKNSNLDLTEDLKNLINKLKEINLKLWVIEDQKRTCEKNKDFGKKFIELSRNVYINNDKRAEIKSEINRLLGSNIKEVKKYASY